MDDIHYLNLQELKALCKTLGTPYYFFAEKDGKLIKLPYHLAKVDVIDRLKKYMLNKSDKEIRKPVVVQPKLFAHRPIKTLCKEDYLYIDQYKNGNKVIYELMRSLTNNKFSFGAVSCFLVRKIFMENRLITYEEFATLYLAELESTILNGCSSAIREIMVKTGLRIGKELPAKKSEEY